MSGGSLRRWSSSVNPRSRAVELLFDETKEATLTLSLAEAAKELRDEAFVVVPIDGLSRADVTHAVEVFHLAGGEARLCLAGGRPSLAALDPAWMDCDRIGLLLDHVDACTSPSELIWDRIEAIRFSDEFVLSAARDLRLGCALESMLGLARDLGLCTLGADAMPGGASLSGRFEFDYMPAPVADSPTRARASAKKSATATLSR